MVGLWLLDQSQTLGCDCLYVTMSLVTGTGWSLTNRSSQFTMISNDVLSREASFTSDLLTQAPPTSGVLPKYADIYLCVLFEQASIDNLVAYRKRGGKLLEWSRRLPTMKTRSFQVSVEDLHIAALVQVCRKYQLLFLRKLSFKVLEEAPAVN